MGERGALLELAKAMLRPDASQRPSAAQVLVQAESLGTPPQDTASP